MGQTLKASQQTHPLHSVMTPGLGKCHRKRCLEYPSYSRVEHSGNPISPLGVDLLPVCISKWPKPLNLKHVINTFLGEWRALSLPVLKCPGAFVFLWQPGGHAEEQGRYLLLGSHGALLGRGRLGPRAGQRVGPKQVYILHLLSPG